tara:strand:- start:826 stop:1422 length:597 start_codon:yes stop_codon:yes gene_type:complete
MMRVLFVTGNQNKVAEAYGILSPLGFYVEQLFIDGKAPDLVEPQAEEIEEIAKYKLEQAVSLTMGTEFENEAVLVEDSGLFIDSLSGFPGPYSSFVKETIGLSGILSLMSGETDRGAEFKAVAAVYFKDKIMTCTGICRGFVSENISGDSGFGYDPIFIPEEANGRTCAQLSPEEKSSISHRGFALKGVSELLIPPSK